MADLPTAAIVCIALAGYVAVLIGVIMLCYFLKGRGKCGESTCCAKKEGTQSCECCIALAEACNCCKGPSLKSCMDSCCPNRKNITCVDIIMCQCCASDGVTYCDCCSDDEKEDQETCNCLCLEIRLRSQEKPTGELKMPPTTQTSNTKHAWMPDPSPFFRSLHSLPESGGMDGFGELVSYGGLQLDLDWFKNVAYPISTHPINTNRSETSGDFVPTSTPRFHQGRSQLFIRPGVHSAGRVIAKRQSGQWPTSRRMSSRRRSMRRSRSPSQRSPNRRRSSRVATNLRPISRRHSHRDQVARFALEMD